MSASGSTSTSQTLSGGAIVFSTLLCICLVCAVGSTISAAVLPQWYTLSVDLSDNNPSEYIYAQQGPFKVCQIGTYLDDGFTWADYCMGISDECDFSITDEYSTYLTYNADQCGRLNASRATLVGGGLSALLAMIPIAALLCVRTRTSKLLCRVFATTFLFVSSALYSVPITLIPGLRNGIINDYVTSEFGASFILTSIAGGLVGICTIIFIISNIYHACTTTPADQINAPLLTQQSNLGHTQFPMNYQPHQLCTAQPQQTTPEGYLHLNYNHANLPTQNHVQHQQPRPLPYYPQLTYPQPHLQQQSHPQYNPYSRNIGQ